MAGAALPQRRMWRRPSCSLRRPALLALAALATTALWGRLSALLLPACFVGSSRLQATATGAARGHSSAADGSAVVLRAVATLKSMTVPELKAMLKDRGLPVAGRKADLIARLEEKAAAGKAEGSGEKEEKEEEEKEEASSGSEPALDLQSMTATQLKALLKGRGLPVSGKKADLIARLEQAGGDGAGKETEEAAPAPAPAPSPKKKKASKSGGAMFEIGELVESYYEDDDAWYDAKVVKDLGSNSFTVAYMSDNIEQECQPGYIRKKMTEVDRDGPIEAGEWVEVYYEEESRWYTGIIQKENADGTVTLLWDEDGEEYTCKPDVMRKNVPRVKLDDLSVGMKMKGFVKSFREFGMFVDVGAERQGLVPISQVPEVARPKKAPAFDPGERVSALYAEENAWYPATVDKANKDGKFTITWDEDGDEPETVEAGNMKLLMPRFPVKIGNEVEVWVTRLDKGDAARFGLSMFEGGRSNFRKPMNAEAFAKMDSKKFIEGEVVDVKDFGIFVKIPAPDGTEATGLLLPSQIKDGYVENIEDELSAGDKVEVRVVRVDKARNRIHLSMLSEW